MGGTVELKGPDLAQGILAAELAEGGTLLGHAGGDAVLLVRRGGEVLAVGATCTHYSGPLAEGLIVGERVVCPWHHASFDLRSGEASAPAFNPVACYTVEARGDRLVVTGKRAPAPRRAAPAGAPRRVVIVGGGAAGHSAAETLRREGHDGTITIVSADESAPYDRPNASKDYLAGNAPEEWMPLRPPEHYAAHGIELRTGTRARSIDLGARTLELGSGDTLTFDALLLAPGAEPIRPDVPGAARPHVHTLRTLADSRAIIARAGNARRVVVLGASFIGLEAAAALRARNISVDVVAPDPPLAKVLGPAVSAFIRALHEAHGVTFHIGATLREIGEATVTLSTGATVPADLVVAGIGVRPQLALAEAGGLAIDRGILVDEFLQTSAPGVYAAGDAARYPEPHGGRRVRIEHWVAAQRQGACAARNLLGKRERFTDVPFFWSQHYDVAINYVGHAEGYDRTVVFGDLAARDGGVAYHEGPRITAVATIGRDLVSLRVEDAMRRGAYDEIPSLLR